LREHRIENQADRCLLSTSFSAPLGATTLAIMIDGMDQAKFKLPRARGHRESHEFKQFKRPKVIVVGVWAASTCLCLYLCDALQPHDASLTIELLARCLERAKAHLAKLGLPFPTEVQIWALCVLNFHVGLDTPKVCVRPGRISKRRASKYQCRNHVRTYSFDLKKDVALI
jgi:hypothetical protein